MAYLIPENLGSSSEVPQAVRDVAVAFRDMVDHDVTVWLEQGETPHLLVLDPLNGVLLVHVVEGGARALVKRSQDSDSSLASLDLDDLIGRFSGTNADLSNRLSSIGGHGAVEVISTAAAPRVKRDTLVAMGFGSPEKLLLKDDFTPETLRTQIGKLAQGGGRLSASDETEVRGRLYPELVIVDRSKPSDGKLMFDPPSATSSEALAVLDRDQERLARHIGDGYRVIKGVAGSGKSLVITFRARFLAENFPHKNYLVACYNRVLADSLKIQLADYPNIRVATVDQLAWQVCRQARIRVSGTGDEKFREQRAAALKAMRSQSFADLFVDAVLVDEAQDLDDVGTELAHAFLAPGADQFIIALDAAQNIYRRQSRWTPEGVTGRGRTKLLRLNYRNTREILDTAYSFLAAGSSSETVEIELDDPDLIVRPEASPRRGERPRILQSGSLADALEAVFRDAAQAHAQGCSWQKMALLVGNSKARRQVQSVAARHAVPIADLSEKGARRTIADIGDVVRVATIQKLKGLEFERVYLVGLDSVEAGRGADDETKRRLVYVGMTRATDHLMLALHGSGQIIEDLLAAADASAESGTNAVRDSSTSEIRPCPECGKRNRVPLGRNVRCAACKALMD